MYEIRYDPAVASDLKKIDQSWQTRILKQIKKKLSSAPSEYGKPLRQALKGYWRLRVGDHRIIYEIDPKREMVTVWLIDKRRDDQVYKVPGTFYKWLINNGF